MLAHWHGHIWNGAEFGRAFGVAHTTVRRYLDLLTSVFVVRQLQPWHENVRKRQVRSPKVYVADSGVLHALLGLSTREAVLSHPKVGASWEGFVVRQIAELLATSPEQCFHWSTHSGAELDLLVVAGNRPFGFDVKRAEAPQPTPSMRSAFETLGLDRLDVVHAGTESYAMAPGIRALCMPEPRATRWPRESGRCLPPVSPRSCDRSRSECHATCVIRMSRSSISANSKRLPYHATIRSWASCPGMSAASRNSMKPSALPTSSGGQRRSPSTNAG